MPHELLGFRLLSNNLTDFQFKFLFAKLVVYPRNKIKAKTAGTN